jgi:hypothetical protein
MLMIDSDSSSKLYVLSTATLTSITKISVPSDHQDAVFIRNSSTIIASIEGSKSTCIL